MKKPNTKDTDGSAWGVRGTSAPACGPGSKRGRRRKEKEDEEDEIDLMALMGFDAATAGEDDGATAAGGGGGDGGGEKEQLKRRVDELEISLLRRDAKSAAESVSLHPSTWPCARSSGSAQLCSVSCLI